MATTLRTPPTNRIRGSEKVLGGAQAQVRDDVKRIFLDASGRIGTVLVRNAGPDGVIPRRRRQDVQREAGEIVSRLFVGRDGRSAFASDGVTALAPYPLALNLALANVQAGAVRIQGEWMQRHVPAEVLAWLKRGQPRQPIVAEQTRTEQLRELYRDLFVDTGNLGYDPAHMFVSEDGYSLSDRIWQAGTRTRAKIDQFIADGIRNGDGALLLAKRLEQFLTPGRAEVRTNKPYGTDASYDAMRLARTEITAAFGRATMAAGRANPYVTGMWWKLSPSHPKPDICDTYEAGSPWALGALPDYPAHPQCVTPGQFVQTARGWLPIEAVREGDKVLTHNARFRTVTGVWNRHYSGLIYKIETEAGCFELTPEHPIMTLCGWVNAEQLQLGDQVLYTGNHISLDLALGKPEGSPAQAEQMLITDAVSHGVVPVFTVTLDGDFELWQGEIENVPTNRILFLEWDGKHGQRIGHQNFNTGTAIEGVETVHGTKAPCGGIAQLDGEAPSTGHADDELLAHSSHVSHQEMGEARVVGSFDCRNLAPGFRLFGRVVVAGHVNLGVGLSHFGSGVQTPSAIVVLPCDFDTFANRAQLVTAKAHQLAESAEIEAKHPADFGTAELLVEIQLTENVHQRFAELFLNPGCVFVKMGSFPAGTAVLAEAGRTTQGAGARFNGHDGNLSSLPLGHGVGAAPRNAVVEQVANPLQAHAHYNTVRAVRVRDYEGPVFNMEVEADHSYTVNGAAVHNCMCALLPLVDKTPEHVSRELQALMLDARTDLLPYLNPAQIDDFTRYLIGDVLDQLFRQRREMDILAFARIIVPF